MYSRTFLHDLMTMANICCYGCCVRPAKLANEHDHSDWVARYAPVPEDIVW